MRLIALIGFIFFLPLLVVSTLILFIEKPKGVIFTQERLGKNRVPFLIYKLRTMVNQKVTSFGRILRKTGIDELPQLINVIKGEMSIVGPRPLTDFDVERLGWGKPIFNDRWKVKPGITGAGQLVSVCDKELSLSEDIRYANDKTPLRDLSILFKTLLVLLKGKRTT